MGGCDGSRGPARARPASCCARAATRACARTRARRTRARTRARRTRGRRARTRTSAPARSGHGARARSGPWAGSWLARPGQCSRLRCKCPPRLVALLICLLPVGCGGQHPHLDDGRAEQAGSSRPMQQPRRGAARVWVCMMSSADQFKQIKCVQ